MTDPHKACWQWLLSRHTDDCNRADAEAALPASGQERKHNSALPALLSAALPLPGLSAATPMLMLLLQQQALHWLAPVPSLATCGAVHSTYQSFQPHPAAAAAQGSESHASQQQLQALLLLMMMMYQSCRSQQRLLLQQYRQRRTQGCCCRCCCCV
jgi:hypothetical protein